ncbi:MAG: hypothetical protein R3Y09_13890 [Clostridia bacterium]
MFEVKKPEFVNKTFRLEKALVDELSQCASESDISLNALIAQCCRYALDNMKNEDKRK